MFDMYDKHFTVITCCAEWLSIDEHHSNEKGMRYFEAVVELVEKF